MNLRYEKFVRAYLRTNNITKSAISAGYSPKTAAFQGSRLLKNVKVKEAIETACKRTNEKGLVDLLEAKRILSRIIRAKLSKYLKENGKVDLEKINKSGQELAELTIENTKFGERRKIKLHDQIAAIERLSRLSGWDTPERLNIEGSILVIE